MVGHGVETAAPRAGRDAAPAISARAVHKRFGHLTALRGATLDVYPGEILALVGDNGAGKSTFMKTLSGALTMDSGTLEFGGEPVEVRSMADAFDRGVYMVYQNLALAPDLAVSDMFYLGHEVLQPGWRRLFGGLDRRHMEAETKTALERVGVRLPSLSAIMQDLSGGQRQALAVAKAMHWADTAILMDEPTAALGPRQTSIVYRAMQHAAERGLAVLVVSHDIPKMLSLADRIAIMRHGEVIAVLTASETSLKEVVTLMLNDDEVDL